LSLILQSSVVQTPVNAKGKNNTTTFFPFKSPNETGFLSVSNKVNCGAALPIKLLIVSCFMDLSSKVKPVEQLMLLLGDL
jgi:hypothetical protein